MVSVTELSSYTIRVASAVSKYLQSVCTISLFLKSASQGELVPEYVYKNRDGSMTSRRMFCSHISVWHFQEFHP